MDIKDFGIMEMKKKHLYPKVVKCAVLPKDTDFF